MKKIIFALIFISSICMNAQVYEFDAMTHYSTKFRLNVSSSINYTNSKNNTYNLRILKYNDSLEGRLYDTKNSKVHYFKVEEITSNEEVVSKFIYKESYDLHTLQKSYSKYVFDYETIEENADFKKVKLNVYKNSKRKKSVAHFDFKLKKIDTNQFYTFRLAFIHHFEFIPKFDIDGSYIVEYAKAVTYDSQIIEHQLLEYKKINLTLNAQ